MYNYFGYSLFPYILKYLFWLNILKVDDSAAFKDTVDNSLNDGIKYHGNLGHLKDFSDTAGFILKMKPLLESLFAKHKNDFPDLNWSSLFSNTILHSLDHYSMEQALQSPFLLDETHRVYGNLAQFGQLVRVGFVTDIPFLMIKRKAKEIKAGFFHELYEEARRVDPILAKEIDICIIK